MSETLVLLTKGLLATVGSSGSQGAFMWLCSSDSLSTPTFLLSLDPSKLVSGVRWGWGSSGDGA